MQIHNILIKRIFDLLITWQSIARRTLVIGFLTIAFLFGQLSCDSLSVQEDVVARVGDQYLYRSELAAAMGTYNSTVDSIQKAKSYITNWAKTRILYQQAIFNLSEADNAHLKKLIHSYEYDLYNATYKERIVSSGLDTLIHEQSIDSVYELKKNLFVLNKPLYQLQYLVVPINNVQLQTIRKSFNTFTEEDLQFLDSLSFQFTRAAYKDSLWINQSELQENLPFLNDENLKLYLKKEVNFEVEVALDVYLFRFLDYKNSGDIAPLDEARVTIRSLIINQRKQNFIKAFEKDLLQDAIQTKKFETY